MQPLRSRRTQKEKRTSLNRSMNVFSADDPFCAPPTKSSKIATDSLAGIEWMNVPVFKTI